MKIMLTVNLAWNLVNFRKGLIEALSADGHELVALCPADQYTVELEKMGCRIIPLSMDNKGISPIRDLALIYRLYNHFRAEKPDAILSYTIKNNIYGAIAAKRLNIPFIPKCDWPWNRFSFRWLVTIDCRQIVSLRLQAAKNDLFSEQ